MIIDQKCSVSKKNYAYIRKDIKNRVHSAILRNFCKKKELEKDFTKTHHRFSNNWWRNIWPFTSYQVS